MPRKTIKGPDGNEYAIESIGFQATGEHWNEYLLDDGSVFKIKLVLTDIYRIVDQYDDKGNPAYMANHTQVVSVDAPDELRKDGS